MSRQTLVWLGAALVVLVLLAVVGQRRSAPPSPSDAETTFLPGLINALDDVSTVTVTAAGNTPVATLDRGAEGWTVRERAGYRADLSKVRHTLLALAEATILEAKTANPEFYAMLGVEDVASAEASGLEITLDGPATPVAVVVGDAAGDYRRYVRRTGEAQSYLINRDPEIGESAAAWLDTAVIDLTSGRVQAVTVTHADGEVVRVTKTAPEQANFTVENVPEGRSLLYDSVANVMGSVLQNLALEDVEPAVDDEEDETITAFTTFDGLTLTVRGIERDDGAWVRFSAAAEPSADAQEATAEAGGLNASLGGWRYRIPSYKFDQLTRGMDDLLQAQTQ